MVVEWIFLFAYLQFTLGKTERGQVLISCSESLEMSVTYKILTPGNSCFLRPGDTGAIQYHRYGEVNFHQSPEKESRIRIPLDKCLCLQITNCFFAALIIILLFKRKACISFLLFIK